MLKPRIARSVLVITAAERLFQVDFFAPANASSASRGRRAPAGQMKLRGGPACLNQPGGTKVAGK
jgi:hypothetical protein